MLPTPSLDHFSREDFQNFYEPHQDSFLFLDSIAQEADFLTQKLKPKIIVEIGYESGIAQHVHNIFFIFLRLIDFTFTRSHIFQCNK
jgi:hypothetical protein